MVFISTNRILFVRAFRVVTDFDIPDGQWP
jgi:hypothetical protein